MKFKQISLSLFAGTALALSLTSTSHADLIVTWHSFQANQFNEVHDYTTSPLSGFVNKGAGLNFSPPPAILPTSFSSGGSNDGNYNPGAPGAPPAPPNPGTNNGFLRVLGGVANAVTFNIFNSSTNYLRLLAVYFDAQSQSGTGGFTDNNKRLSVAANGNVFGQTTTVPSGSFANQFIEADDVYLPPGTTIQISFSALQAARFHNIDNIAFDFVAVPEPGNVLGLGALLGSTMVMRNRRRKLIPAKA